MRSRDRGGTGRKCSQKGNRKIQPRGIQQKHPTTRCSFAAQSSPQRQGLVRKLAIGQHTGFGFAISEEGNGAILALGDLLPFESAFFS